MRVIGVDASHYQGRVDWQAVRGWGAGFAYLKVSDGFAMENGSKVDPRFEANQAGCREAGLPWGGYHFLRPEEPIQAQAALFAPLAREGKLPPAVDVETTGGLKRAQLARRVKEFLDLVERMAGEKPIIYTNCSTWEGGLGSPAWSTDYDLWIANPGVGGVERQAAPAVPRPWTGWRLWQYCWKGRVPGIQGEALLDRFNGDEAELGEWLGLPAPGPTLEARVRRLEERVFGVAG